MKFTYQGIDKDGVQVTSSIEAANHDAAISELQARQVVILSIDEVTSREFKIPEGLQKLNPFGPKVRQKDLVIFSRQVATLFEAGVSALKAFILLAAENDNKAMKELLTGVADDIQTGIAMSEAMEKRPKLFSPFYVNMVKAGEESGKLNETFLYLADYLDRDYELTQKTKKALTYPIFVVAIFFIIMIGMFTFVIPKMANLFAEQGASLPTITRVILAISDFFRDYIAIIIPGTIGGIILFIRYSHTENGRYFVDRLKTKTPVFKILFEKIFLARLADNMNTMLSSGVSILRAIEITADVVDNVVYRAVLLGVAEKVQNGMSFSQALSEDKSLPNILIQMSRIGEETGKLGYILKNLANFYKREVEGAIDAVIGLIEPAMIVGLGLMVSLLVAGVLLPIFALSQTF